GIKRSPTRSSNGKDDEDEDEDRAARVRRARRDLSSSPADGRPSLILLDSLSSSPPRRETNMWSPAHQATAPAAAEHAV
ncbi:hypothetical protein NQU36_28940, partial [Escherichia coli]|uniref:hypothetical protein n=1 Tax=Escherichia coli TaxID=562 RepID=UPI00211955C1